MFAAPVRTARRTFVPTLPWVLLAGVFLPGPQTQAQVLAGCTNGALPIQAYNRSTGQYAAIIDVDRQPVRGLAADDARRLLYFSTGSYFYRVAYDQPSPPVLIGQFHGDATQISGGLAYDSGRGVLIGSSGAQFNGLSSSFYEIDTQTAATRLVLAVGAGDFGGIDYDPTEDVLYGVNDSTNTAAGLTGRGLYRITLPLGPDSFTRIADAPIKVGTTVDLDIDGLAVGGGRVYMCADETNWMYIFDLSTGLYEPPVAQPAFGTDRVSCGATYAASFFLSPRPDGAASITAPEDCSVHASGEATFSAQARNAGTGPLSGVTLRALIPAGASFVSSDPAGVMNAGMLTVAVGDLGPGEFSPITITLLPHGAGTLALSVTTSSSQPDENPSNNSATASTRVLPVPPAVARATAIASTVLASSSSSVPGGFGARYRDAGVDSFGPPFTSPDGQRLIFAAHADSGPPGTGTLVLAVNGQSTQLAARQGVFPAVPGSASAPVEISNRLSINNAGHWAMAGSDQAGPFIARVNGAGAWAVARQGDFVPGIVGDARYAASLRSPGIAEDGTVAFAATLVGPDVPTGTGEAILGADGSTVLVRSGLDIPFGQVDENGLETYFPVRTLDIDDGAISLHSGGSGDRYIVGGFLGGPGGSDRVLIREHPFGGPAIAIQEGRPVAGTGGTAGPGAPIVHAWMSPGGALVVGITTMGEAFVVRENAVLALSGRPIVTGGAERWAAAVDAFLGAGANAGGDGVVVGVTNAADPLSNSAAVLNGTTILARENDPVDLDGNGVFDDGAYLAEFVPFRCVLGSDRFVTSVRLRSEQAATACRADDTLGYALIAVAFTPGPSFCAADFNQDGGIDGSDVEAFFVAWEAAEPLSDVNQDGGIDGGDVESFFTLWEAGGCP